MTDEQQENRNALIEAKISIERSSEISLGFGPNLQNMAQAFEIAKAMAISGPCVPSYLRGNPGSCLYIIMRADRWKIDPFALAEKSYMVENKGEQRIAFESQVFRAVVESLAPLQGRLTHRYEGEGDERVCIVSGKLKGDTEVREHKSPTLGKRRPTKNEWGKVKGSPLWETKPDVQLLYDTQRDWVRINCPDVVMGVYTRDEMEDAGFEVVQSLPAPVVKADSEGLLHRLSARAAVAAGFDADGVAATIQEASGRASESAQPEKSASTGAPIPSGSPLDAQAAPDPQASSPGAVGESGAAVNSEVSPPREASAQGPALVSHPDAGPDLPDSAADKPSVADEALSQDEPASAAAVAEEPIASAPETPKHEGEYVAYVRAMLEMPGMGDAKNVHDWWTKNRKVRSALVNMTPEILAEAKKLIMDRIESLKA